MKHVIERAFILAGDRLEADSLPVEAEAPAQVRGEGLGIEVGMSVAEVERRLLSATLERFKGDKKRAAKVLGISLKTLYNRLHAYDDLSRGSVMPPHIAEAAAAPASAE